MRFLLLFCIACSSSHMNLDGGSDVDGGSTVDVGSGFDGGLVDVGVDAFDAGTDAGSLSCRVSFGEMIGEPCFCNGPAARFGDYVYRQSIGIEVYDVSDPERPREVFRVDERPSAGGGLVVVDDHLISIVDFEPDPVRVYSLSDPARPREVVRFGDIATHSVAGHGQHLLLARTDRERQGHLTYVDLSNPRSPSIVWDRPTESPPIAIALSSDGLFVLEADAPGVGGAMLRKLDDAGDERAMFHFDVSSFGQRLLARPGELLMTGGFTRLTRFDVTRGLVVDETLHTAPSFEAVLPRRDGTLVLSSPLTVLTPDLQEVALDGESRGFEHLLEGAGSVLYGSNGGGVMPFRLDCERR